jgi:hypothetical protein
VVRYLGSRWWLEDGSSQLLRRKVIPRLFKNHTGSDAFLTTTTFHMVVKCTHLKSRILKSIRRDAYHRFKPHSLEADINEPTSNQQRACCVPLTAIGGRPHGRRNGPFPGCSTYQLSSRSIQTTTCELIAHYAYRK